VRAVLIILLMLSCFLSGSFAQVPDTIWTYDLLAQCFGSPACADIDFDGYLEIVFGTYFDDEHAYALNAEDGSLHWRFDVGGGPLDAAPVIADVDLDDSLEVIIPASWGIIFCLSGNGELEWRYPQSGWIECIDSPPAVADVDEDGLPEVIFGAWYGKLYVLNGEDGSVAWQQTYDADGYRHV
jgi:outer membrane protein assembly factor BamB